MYIPTHSFDLTTDLLFPWKINHHSEVPLEVNQVF